MGSREEREKRAEERALTLQEREMHGYYQPWLQSCGSSTSIASHIQDLADCDEFDPHTLSNIGYSANASQDKALTSFAQLASLRLGVRRCMVSLIDSTHQYILAEATKTLSLVDASRHAENDALWLGHAVIPREEAVCQCVLQRTYTVKDGKGESVTVPGAVIPDCRDDDEFKDKPYVIQEPGVRFYAGVPIRSRSGILIGVYAVSSDTTRAPLTYDEVRFMQDVSVAITEHLEWARDRVDRFKGERIVRGMATFIESSPSMRGISDDQDKEKEDRENNNQTSSPKRPTAQQEDHPSENSLNPSIPRPKGGPSPRPSFERRSPSFTKRAEAKIDNLPKLLNRAARVLRESALAEGVVFFGPRSQASVNPILGASMTDNEKWLSTDDESSKRRSVNSVIEDEASTDSDALNHTQILGISLTNKKDTSSFHNTNLSVSTLERYFKLYPRGKSLHFSEAGAGLSSGDDSTSESHISESDKNKYSIETTSEKVITRRRKARMNHHELLKNLPGVKNVIFLPLWDYVEGKMVAGAFLWTSNTGRMMNLDDDLSYLRAFGNTIMGEVARMNAMRDDRAKTTFIASMSHELRSPLHGILGSVEFLQETASDSYQSGLINSIATCGKTLLDTLDHVLDHAKINKLGRSRTKKGARVTRLTSAVESTSESLNIVADIDLAVVAEEVVEAVCAGHAFKKMHTAQLQSRNNPRLTVTRVSSGVVDTSAADGENIREGEVAVLLDVSPRVSWRVRTIPGALRRIIMNLLGNSLKYTARGFVAVSLRAQESNTPNKIDVIFRVVDSGKGMSEDFQKNRLFVPFSQEDSFQPGTGLGLSIVRQIVDSLGGNIDIHSVQNVGTEVDVRLSLDTADVVIDVPDEEITSVAAKTRGVRLCLLDPNGEKRKDQNDHIERLDTTISEVCWGWFEMEVTKASKLDDVDADVFLYTEPPSVEYLLEHHSSNRRQGKDGSNGKEVPLIIVCLNASEAIEVSAHHTKELSKLGRIVEVVPQPCGPRKLAKVLGHCIRRSEEAFGRSLSTETDKQRSVSTHNIEDMGAASMLGVSTSSLPYLSHSDEQEESHRTRRYLRDMATSVPPSTAVAFPTERRLSQAEPRPLQHQLPSDNAPNILLVDDNKINRQLLVMFMKKHKFPYQEAENGQEALDKYIEFCGPDAHQNGKQAFEMILMDITMPIMDGFESTRRIRQFEKEHKLKRSKIIALTGLASAEAQAEAESSGIDTYLAKPVKFQTLKPLLERKKDFEKVLKDVLKDSNIETQAAENKSKHESNGRSTGTNESYSEAGANQPDQNTQSQREVSSVSNDTASALVSRSQEDQNDQ